jgi:putative SOS response-associated peptidase YedK
VNKKTKDEIQSYTVVTTDANSLLARIHNTKKRMPVILQRDEEREWISSSLTKEQAVSLLSPFPASELEAFTISRLITAKKRNQNVPEVLRPFSYPEFQTDVGQTNLF